MEIKLKTEHFDSRSGGWEVLVKQRGGRGGEFTKPRSFTLSDTKTSTSVRK